MMPLVSPWKNNSFGDGSIDWAAYQAAIISAVYPSGVIATGADTVEDPFTLANTPAEASKVIRYTVADPGGRSGGSPLYTWRLPPVAARTGELLIFNCGHLADAWTSSYYCAADGTSIIRRALAAGMDVLVTNPPAYGLQPDPQVINIVDAGPTEVSGHAYSAVMSDGGPNFLRIFSDVVIRSLTTAIAALHPTKIYMVGHSGGGWLSALLGVLDSRLDVTACLQGCMPNSACVHAITASPNDLEQDTITCPLYSLVPSRGVAGLVMVRAALGGACFVGNGTQDPVTPANVAKYPEYWGQVADLSLIAGGSFLHSMSAVVHEITAAEATATLAFLATAH
jgi:pimeloyl-ACP methyl ester carboxylesterase